MARNQTPRARIATAKGTAHFAYIDKPDSGREYSDDKYKVTISFAENDPFVKELEAKVDALLAEHFGDRIPRSVHNPIKHGDDTNVDALSGRVFIRAKSGKQPQLLDAKNNPVPEGITVFSGDIIRAAVTLAVFDGAQKGVTAYLDMVKIIEKRNVGSSDNGNIFGDDEGFVAPAAAPVAAESAPFSDDDDF